MTKAESKFSEQILQWYDLHRRILPWRTHRTAYTTWVSEVMLQQTQVNTVIPYFHRFLDAFPDIETLSRARPEHVHKLWEGLGYYSRATNLQRGALYCVENFNRQIPTKRKDLLKIPGIGPYIAGAILSMVFNQKEPAIDGNMIRVFSRYYARPMEMGTSTSIRTGYDLALDVLSDERPGDFNEAMMDLGATICTPKSPSCDICPFSISCQAHMLGIQGDLPLRKKTKKIPCVDLSVCVLVRGNQIYLKKRPPNGLLAGLFEYLLIPEHQDKEKIVSYLKEHLKIPPETIKEIRNLPSSPFRFSHLEWNMRGFWIELYKEKTDTPSEMTLSDHPNIGAFYSTDIIHELAFPTALDTYNSIVRNTFKKDE